MCGSWPEPAVGAMVVVQFGTHAVPATWCGPAPGVVSCEAPDDMPPGSVSVVLVVDGVPASQHVPFTFIAVSLAAAVDAAAADGRPDTRIRERAAAASLAKSAPLAHASWEDFVCESNRKKLAGIAIHGLIVGGLCVVFF